MSFGDKGHDIVRTLTVLLFGKGDLAIVTNDKLRNTLRKGPKYCESKHINRNFKLLMDSGENYHRKWAKQEEVELDTLSDWMTSIRSLIRK